MELPRFGDADKVEATPEEFKAMAHPLRLRILRLCLYEALTNKQIADQLGKDPATTLHHVRMLHRTGFLEAEPPRSGNRGALERPYRATGKSWVLSVPRPEDKHTVKLAAVDALRDELAETQDEDVLVETRLGFKLSREAAAELQVRLDELVRELHGLGVDSEGDAYGFFVTLHRRPS
jgi:predicted ArsR family transcriptional regulator